MSAEWINVVIGFLSLFLGIIGGLIAGVWRIARIEGRLKLYMQSTIASFEQKFADKLDSSVSVFDETLKGLRQKLNDVEMDSIRLYVQKSDFNEFRAEYREDMRDIKHSLDVLNKHKG